MEKDQKRGALLMCVCACMWSIGGLFIKLLAWHPLVTAGWRSLIAAICIGLYMLINRVRLRVNRYSVSSAVLLALVMLIFVCANKLTTAANAIVLQFTSPIFILVLSAFLYRQRPTRADLITVGVTMLGISMFFFDQLSSGSLMGNFLAILSGFFLAGMFLTTGSSDMESRLSGLFLGQLLAGLIGAPMTLLFPTTFDTASVVSVLILGIVQLGVPYIFYSFAVKGCPPLACSLIGAIEPLLNPVWVFLVTGERPGGFALVGGVVVITTITVWCVRRDRTVAAQQSA